MQEVAMTPKELRELCAFRVRQFKRRHGFQKAMAQLDDETRLQARNKGLLKRFSSSVVKFLSRHA